MILDHRELLPTDIPFETDASGSFKCIGVDVSKLRGSETSLPQDEGIYRRDHRSNLLNADAPPIGDRAVGAVLSERTLDPNLAATPQTTEMLIKYLREELEKLGMRETSEGLTTAVDLPEKLAELMFAERRAVIQCLENSKFILKLQPLREDYPSRPGDVAFTHGRYLCDRTGEYGERALDRASTMFALINSRENENAESELEAALLEAASSCSLTFQSKHYKMSTRGELQECTESDPQKRNTRVCALNPDIIIQAKLPLPPGFSMRQSESPSAEGDSKLSGNLFLLALEDKIRNLLQSSPAIINAALASANKNWAQSVEGIDMSSKSLTSSRELTGSLENLDCHGFKLYEGWRLVSHGYNDTKYKTRGKTAKEFHIITGLQTDEQSPLKVKVEGAQNGQFSIKITMPTTPTGKLLGEKVIDSERPRSATLRRMWGGGRNDNSGYPELDEIKRWEARI